MSTLSDLLAEHTSLTGGAVAHLQQLVSEWQLISDLSFADLTLWVLTETPDPTGEARQGDTLVCVAQVRPTTVGTVHPDDLVARRVDGPDARVFHQAVLGVTSSGPIVTVADGGVQRTCLAVPYQDAAVAVLVHDSADHAADGPSALETAYRDASQSLLGMVADGTFPWPDQPGEMHTGPRAGDGLLRLDPDGSVEYVSPNALSAYHRLGFAGDLAHTQVAALTRSLVPDPFDASELAARIVGAVHGRPSLRMEIEAKGATVLFRAIPLLIAGVPAGALLLVRDVTEVRRRDRALISKDATIREIHHRVKNNLQTVAALLRLQARRSKEESVRHALNESVRRVASIALVHETLSTAPDDRLDLDQIIDRLVPTLSEVAAAESPARIQRVGSFGVLAADRATPLVMVLAEVVQNALQHAYPQGGSGNKVVVKVERTARELQVDVIDDGVGLPEGFRLDASTGLGLQIVKTLVSAELGGSLVMRNREDAPGSVARISVPLRRRG